MNLIEIDLCAKLPEGFAFVDIETRKTDVPSSFYHLLPSGYSMKRRWQCFLIGLALDDKLFLAYGDEAEILEWFSEKVAGRKVVYISRNGFDEHILGGTFTNARSPKMKKPGPWPHCRQTMTWLRISPKDVYGFSDRPLDIESKEVPEAWDAGKKEIVLIHCLRDVFEGFWALEDAHDVRLPEILSDPNNEIYQKWKPK